jgi:hypothetical protein
MRVQIGDFVQTVDGMPRGYVIRIGTMPIGKKKVPAVIIDAGGGREQSLLLDETIILYRGEEEINERAELKSFGYKRGKEMNKANARKSLKAIQRRKALKSAVKNALSDALWDAALNILPVYGPRRIERQKWEDAIDSELVALQKMLKKYKDSMNKMKATWAALSSLDTVQSTLANIIETTAPTLIQSPQTLAYFSNFLTLIVNETARLKPLTQAEGGNRLQNVVNILDNAILDVDAAEKEEIVAEFEKLGNAPKKPSFLPRSYVRSLYLQDKMRGKV